MHTSADKMENSAGVQNEIGSGRVSDSVEARSCPDLTLFAYFRQGLCNCSNVAHLWKKSCSRVDAKGAVVAFCARNTIGRKRI